MWIRITCLLVESVLKARPTCFIMVRATCLYVERMQEEVCETEMDRVRGAKYVPHEVLEAERSRVKGANYVPHEVFGAVRRRVRGANYVPHDACEVRDRRYGTSSEPRAPVWFETEDYSVENPYILTRNVKVKKEQRVLQPL